MMTPRGPILRRTCRALDAERSCYTGLFVILILSAMLTALIIIVAFISAYYNFAHEYGVALPFVGALVAFCLSLIDLAREASIALHDNDLRA